jgi:YT521-B-like domain
VALLNFYPGMIRAITRMSGTMIAGKGKYCYSGSHCPYLTSCFSRFTIEWLRSDEIPFELVDNLKVNKGSTWSVTTGFDGTEICKASGLGMLIAFSAVARKIPGLRSGVGKSLQHSFSFEEIRSASNDEINTSRDSRRAITQDDETSSKRVRHN